MELYIKKDKILKPSENLYHILNEEDLPLKHLYDVLKKRGQFAALATLMECYPDLGVKDFSYLKKKFESIEEFLIGDTINDIEIVKEVDFIEKPDMIKNLVKRKDFTDKDLPMKLLYTVLKKRGEFLALDVLIECYPKLGMKNFSSFRQNFELIEEFLNMDLETFNKIYIVETLEILNEVCIFETLDTIEGWVNHKEFTETELAMKHLYDVLKKKGRFEALDVLMEYFPKLGLKRFNALKENFVSIEKFLKNKNNNKY